MRYIWTIFIMLCVLGILYCSSSRNYTFSVPKLNEEIDNIYYQIFNNNYFKTRTTAQLNGMTPSRVGEHYWNTDTNELWVATNTVVNAWINK